MKIGIYSICKNKEKHVDRFINSTTGADLVLVCDIGSTDGSIAKLRERGAIVYEIKIERHDEARNKALELLPEDVDVCICLDLDETLMPEWRKEIERVRNDKIDRLCYRYAYNHRSDGSPDVMFMVEQIHARKNYTWRHPIREYVYWTGERMECKVHIDPDKIMVERWADDGDQRLELLEWAAREEPENNRNSYRLAYEYLIAARWVEAKQEFIRHLSLKNVWDVERCASMRHLARCCVMLGQETEAQQWLLQACAQCLYEREPWVELGQFYLDRKEWLGAYHAAKRALIFQKQPLHGVAPSDCWGSKPHIIVGISAFNLGFYKEALKHYIEAIQLNSNDSMTFQRIKETINKL